MKFRANQAGLDLGGRWSLAFGDRRIDGPIESVDAFREAGMSVFPAEVPGNFELDLLANGLIDDPFVGMNIVDLRKFENTFVYYFRTFVAPAESDTTPVLVFEGIDCFADVLLNGQLVYQADNMLIEHHIAVQGALRPGRENSICVVLEPAMARARSGPFDYPAGLFAEGSGYEGLYVRKAPHMYGWDIMPRALSAGIWRPVTLRSLPPERLEWAWLETESIGADGDAAHLALHHRSTTRPDPGATYEMRVLGQCGDSKFDERSHLLFDAGCVRFDVPSARLWWPRGRGEANLYDVSVELIKNGATIDTLSFTHGIRSIELDRTSITDEVGTGEFLFRVNGERIFVLGTNWVPVDAFHSRDAERIPAALDLADDLGCNMIRCWGGNVYEDDLFYDLCDRKGILVWQDFAMACAVYPQDPAFQATIRVEAQQVVRRLRQHACLVIWAGDNECDMSHVQNGRRRDPNTNVLTREVLPAVLRDEDPSRAYLPSSPYVDPIAFAAGERYLPEDHLWGPRDYYKSSFYTTALCHFASEIGYHGCPEPDSLRKFLSPDRVWPYRANEQWLLHSTSPIPGVDIHDYRVELMASQVRVLFGSVPDTVEDFAYASQASQAEAMKFFVEMFRMGKWRRTGIIWWNLIDGWPQLSDAVVDYYFARKRAYHALKRSQLPICVMLREPSAGAQDLVVVNDTRDDIDVAFSVHDVDTGEELAAGTVTASADDVTALGRIPVSADTQRCYRLTWDTRLGSAWSHYLAGSPPFDLDRYRSWMERVEEPRCDRSRT
jgi:beta-mannosidase